MSVKLTTLPDYTTLLNQVKTTLIEGQKRIEAERVKTYWETGRLIQTHILKHAQRAEYGGEVIKRLAKDIKVNKVLLHRCVKFAQRYSRLPIVAARQQFTWSHYRELITIANPKKRVQFEKEALRNSWSTDELAARIREGRPESATSDESRLPAGEPRATSDKPLTPLRGELYTYKIVERPTVGVGEDSGLLVDLGFGIFRNVEGRLLSAFQKDDIVRSRPGSTSSTEESRTTPRERKRSEGLQLYKFSKVGASVKDLYTYQAFVERVIDGDTLKVRFDLGFDTFTRQTLRLRGIDCPEVDTKEGQEAKAFVQSYIKEAQMIIVRSSRSDKYDRYLADVYIPQGGEADPKSDLYLNNLLLDNNYAVRMD